jgi:hypothetical protein
MNLHALVTAVLLTPALQVLGAAGPPAWQDGTSKEGGYAVQFPATPKQERVNFPTSDGQAKMVRQYAIVPNKANYAVAHVDFPAAYVKRLTPRGVIKETLKDMAGPPGAKVSGEKESMLGKHPGVEFTVQFKVQDVDLLGSGRIYMVGDRAYMLLVMGRKDGGPSAEDLGKFFQSFRLLAPAVGG